MNSSQQAQSDNRKFFLASLVISVALLACSGFFLKSLVSGGSDKPIKLAQKSCMSRLRSTPGWEPKTLSSGEIQASHGVTDSVEPLVFQSGVLISSCLAYTLTSYCAGAAGCPTPGVTFTLKPL